MVPRIAFSIRLTKRMPRGPGRAGTVPVSQAGAEEGAVDACRRMPAYRAAHRNRCRYRRSRCGVSKRHVHPPAGHIHVAIDRGQGHRFVWRDLPHGHDYFPFVEWATTDPPRSVTDTLPVRFVASISAAMPATLIIPPSAESTLTLVVRGLEFPDQCLRNCRFGQIRCCYSR
jgi:hypothetical protein